MRDGEVLASLELATSRRDRVVGLLGRGEIDGALLIRPARSVHTIGMRFPIDVAFLDDSDVVLRTVTMRPWRVGRPVLRSRAVIEAGAGAFAHWELRPGDAVEVRGAEG